MKLRARVSETGCEVSAANDGDWKMVYRTGLVLYCRTKGCSAKVKAVQRKRSDGGITRFFSYISGNHCDHRDDDGCHVTPPPRIGHHPSAPESAEHKWLAETVIRIALAAGHLSAQKEVRLGAAVRADVFVPDVPRSRIEIQRGQTDIQERTRLHPDVLWLLRMSHDDANTRWLFDQPCVQVRIRHCSGRPARPWEEPLSPDDYTVDATSTVLRRSFAMNSDRFFTSRPLPVQIFLEQVWRGERVWVPRGRCHRTAGWVLTKDLAAHDEWCAARAQAAATQPPTVMTTAQEKPISTDAASKELVADEPAPEVAVEDEAEWRTARRLTSSTEGEVASPVGEPPHPTRGWWGRFRTWLLGRPDGPVRHDHSSLQRDYNHEL